MDAPQLSTGNRWRNTIWATAVLLGSWLLFQIQPMVGKRVLPWFGGGPSVWTTALLFFQAALLVGYLYAHVSVRFLRPRAQLVLHLALLAGAVVVLVCEGVVASDAWKPVTLQFPSLQVLKILAGTVGLAYVALAATAPLIQFWWGQESTRPPYRLYALSNFGALLALVSYPVIVEPHIGLIAQGRIWFSIFGLFALLCALSAWIAYLATENASSVCPASQHTTAELGDEKIAKLDRFLWLALPACASALLLAVTNYLCQDVASLPLIWLAPLAMYLITFIVAFDADRWYVRPLWMGALCLVSFAACICWRRGTEVSLNWQIGSHLALLLCAGMVCHGEVARLRPSQRWLTSYYLHIAMGGVLGGLFVAVIAPLIFVGYYELPLAVLGAWVLAMIVLASDKRGRMSSGGVAWLAAVVLWGMLATLYATAPPSSRVPVVASERDFFGILRVCELATGGKPSFRQLLNGRISHGCQFLSDERRRKPTTYYSSSSGIGQLFAQLPAAGGKRVGIVGLGVGTLASYAEKGDVFRYYEINPRVISLADTYFTYLRDARQRGAEVAIVEGDARLTLEGEQPQHFDVLVLDAFSGDAIPIHLLTREAFSVLKRHLSPTGILAVHISNRHLDLAPIVASSARESGYGGVRVVTSDNDFRNGIQAAVWALVYQPGQGQLLQSLGRAFTEAPNEQRTVWTDDYSSILNVLKFE